MKPNRADAATLLLFGLCLTATATSTFSATPFHYLARFGTEYGNLAENLALGNGFSGTFEVSHQASAWMPPLLPLIIAGSFLCFGIRSAAAAQALMILQVLMIWSSLYLLLLVARPISSTRWPLGALFGGFVWWNRAALFGHFHDMGLTVFLSVSALYALILLSRGRVVWPMVCGAILPISSPSLALPYAILTIGSGGGRKRILAVLACSFLSVSGWTLRNTLALDTFVPLKSNLWFDFYQANVSDPDGIVAESTFYRCHPSSGSNLAVRAAYRKGETAFMAWHRQQSLESVQGDPGAFLARILHRLFNATILLSSDRDMGPSALLLEADEQAYLMKRHLLAGAEGGGVWCSFELNPAFVRSQLQGLGPVEAEHLFNDWRRARKIQFAAAQSWDLRLWGLAHALLPLLAILLGAYRPALRRQRAFAFAVGLYGLYLAPYILISHYARYQISLIGLATFLIWLGGRSLFAVQSERTEPDSIESHGKRPVVEIA